MTNEELRRRLPEAVVDSEITMEWHAAIIALLDRVERAEAVWRDSAAMHINLCRTRILTREQLLHLLGDAAQTEAASNARRAALEEADITLRQGARIIERRDAERARPAPQLSGDACMNCGNFSLVRSGTCMTCQACGETTGCS